MDQRTFATLELESLIDLLARHVQTPMGRRRTLGLRPNADRSQIDHALCLTSECAEFLSDGSRFGLGGIEDPEKPISQLQVEGTSLEPKQILNLERLISTGMSLGDLFRDPESRRRFPRLSGITAGIPDLRRILAEIRGKILPGGEIDDNASPELRALRRDLQLSRSRIHRSLEGIFRAQPRALQEEIVTFRNGRFVIPVRTDSRSLVAGVVHGLSSSGQTTFVEPLSVIEQNNELVRLREQEEAEVSKILFALTDLLRSQLPAIRVVAEVVTEMDFAQAKGLMSAEFHCVRPQLSEDCKIILHDARHILLEHALRKSADTIVPISLELDAEHQVLVISGPNAGGKTVVLKTVGLIALMAQMGLHVPASRAVLPVYSQIFTDIGDQQSIAANLSTFTAHIRNISDMVEHIQPPTLLLIDEAGTGTDPDEGAALAVAIIDYFRMAGITTIATTHYHALKMWASQTQGVRTSSVEFDENTLRPTFRLLMDVAGASAGLEIARRMNLPCAILSSAKSRLDPMHAQASDYLRRLKSALDEQEMRNRQLEKERELTSEKYAKLDLEFARKEMDRRAQFDEALASAMHAFTEESERLIRSLKDRIEAARLKKAAANRAAELRQAGERLRAGIATKQGGASSAPHIASLPAAEGRPEPIPITTASSDLKSGDRVRIQSVKRDGIVESVQDGLYAVQVGPLRFKTGREDLQLLTSSAEVPAPPGTRRQASSIALDTDKDFSTELNVIGLTAEEATDRVDKFLDEALVAGVESIRIIHGHGKGILRRTIAKYLSEHPQVERFQLAPPEKGGGGATLVELRK